MTTRFNSPRPNNMALQFITMARVVSEIDKEDKKILDIFNNNKK